MLGIIRVCEFIVLQITTIGHFYFIVFSLCMYACVYVWVCKLSTSFVFLSIVMFIFFLWISKSSLYINNIKYLSLKAILTYSTTVLWSLYVFIRAKVSKIQGRERTEIFLFLSFHHKVEDIRNPQMILKINGPHY